MRLAVYGAKSLALGTYFAIKELYPEYKIECFLVTSKKENPDTLAGLPVKEIYVYSQEVNPKEIHILVGTPEDIHTEIEEKLKEYGFFQYTCLDSKKEARLMERYFGKIGRFPSIHSLNCPFDSDRASLQVFMAKSYKDKPLHNLYELPDWIYSLQVGAELTSIRNASFADNMGENISQKNGNYCELTALYWIWKNKLTEDNLDANNREYYGLFHYRRILELSELDLCRIKANAIDVILPFPTLHEPDIQEHHVRYIQESDWNFMLEAMGELTPEYALKFSEIFHQTYFYNYNLIIAKKEVLADYCSWLFPILERTEELSNSNGNKNNSRYIGYIAESLMTLYFLLNKDNLRIVHTGWLMLT